MGPRATHSNLGRFSILSPRKRLGVTPSPLQTSPHRPSPFSLTLLQAHVLLSLIHVQSYQRFRDSFPGRVHQDWDGQRNKGRDRKGKWEGSGSQWEGLGKGRGAGKGPIWGKQGFSRK